MSLPKVLSYPPRHIYVNRLHDVAAIFIERDELAPRLAHFYNLQWIRENEKKWDIVHFHFGWEQYPLEHITEVVAAHVRTGKPIVVTVHDTRNPHTKDSVADQAYLTVILHAASAVVTLTPSAASHIRDTYGVNVMVIPHGPLLTRDRMEHYRHVQHQTLEAETIYVHLKGGRTNLDWQRLLVMAPAIKRQSGYTLKFGVRINSDIHTYVSGMSEVYAEHIILQSEVTDDELYAEMIRHAAVLLPYRWGSHSGMIELAKDLGVPSIVYDTGHYEDQHPSFLVPYETDETDQLAAIVHALNELRTGDVSPLATANRMKELDEFVQNYRQVYQKVRPS